MFINGLTFSIHYFQGFSHFPDRRSDPESSFVVGIEEEDPGAVLEDCHRVETRSIEAALPVTWVAAFVPATLLVGGEEIVDGRNAVSHLDKSSRITQI